MSGPPLSMLARSLRPSERASIERRFRRALRTGTSCELPATAFVSLYERGRVIGCVGHADFRSALGAARVDPRFGGPRGEPLTVQLSLLVRGPLGSLDAVPDEIELGEEGLVALDAAQAIRAVLLPDVAPDGQRDGAAMRSALIDKAGGEATEIARVMRVRRERFVLRPETLRVRVRTPVDAAAAWLARLVDADGAVAHGIDARAGRIHRTGPFHVGRAAVVIEALAAHGGHAAALRRARRWLAATLASGESLPRTAAERAGTFALAVRAGVDAAAALRTLDGQAEAIASVPWHAAQLVTVLGSSAPARVREAALQAIDDDVLAPWSVLAAEALGEARRARRGRDRIARAIPAKGPHPGGARGQSVPEVALTALALEVLAPSRAHAAAARRALAFLRTQAMLRVDQVHPALDPSLALGAYPLAPHADFLRADATAHALLAQLAARRARLTTR